MRILLLEDENIIANNIKDYLFLKEKWDIDIAKSLEEATKKIQNNYYDLYIFDVMLSDGESYNLAKEIKKIDSNKPIIFLTAKGELEDKLLGFDSGGDDYITKPFELDELIARIKVLMKRYGIHKYIFDNNLIIDLDKFEVIKDGNKIDLNKTEWFILDYLLKNKGKVVSRSDLISYVWGDNDIFDKKVDRKLDVYITSLRKKLGKKFIETIKGIGYKIN